MGLSTETLLQKNEYFLEIYVMNFDLEALAQGPQFHLNTTCEAQSATEETRRKFIYTV